MKKFDFKKIIIFVLALIMMFSLASCNKTPDDGGGGEGDDSAQLIEALDALIDGLDGVIGTAKSIDDEMYAELALFVKAGTDVDLEIQVAANIAPNKTEVKLAVLTDKKQLIAFYLIDDILYVQDNFSNAKITYNDGVAKIVPAATAANFSFSAEGGIAGTILSDEIVQLPGLLAGLFEDFGDSIGELAIGGFEVFDIIELVAGLDDFFGAAKTSTGYELAIKVNELASILDIVGALGGGDGEEEGDPLDALTGLLGDDADDLIGLIDQVVELIFGATLADLLDEEVEITDYPNIAIGFDLNNSALSGLSLKYSFDKNEMDLHAGIKNLKIESKAKASIKPSGTFNSGALKVDLGLKAFGEEANLAVFASPVDTEEGTGAEGYVTLNGDIIGYGRVEGDGVMGALIDFTSLFDMLGIGFNDALSFYAGTLLAKQPAVPPSDAEGDDDDGGIDIMSLIGPIFNLILGDNSLLNIISDKKLDTGELLGLANVVEGLLGAFGVDREGEAIALDKEGLADLLKEGLSFIAELEGFPEGWEKPTLETDADYIAFLNAIFDTDLTGTSLEALLFAENGINIGFDFPATGFGIEVKLNVGSKQILALSLKVGFAAAFDGGDWVEELDADATIDDIDDLNSVGMALLNWLLSAKQPA